LWVNQPSCVCCSDNNNAQLCTLIKHETMQGGSHSTVSLSHCKCTKLHIQARALAQKPGN
jgi:hypothetical protein